jgi:predicted dithiol-disulfide oxidoreductase (DUF899 family)
MTDHKIGTLKSGLRPASSSSRREGAHAASDELARRRQQLPWVRIDKEYLFETA